ncbi:MAG: hypothetical protein NZM12_09950, partial [Steroidobacteraceae bacterium]|nr:hypothetical protein [Steroidobacteraceae bacterium]
MQATSDSRRNLAPALACSALLHAGLIAIARLPAAPTTDPLAVSDLRVWIDAPGAEDSAHETRADT